MADTGLVDTSVRGVPRATMDAFRQIMAKRVRDTGGLVSLNSLYVEALNEYADRRKTDS